MRTLLNRATSRQIFQDAKTTPGTTSAVEEGKREKERRVASAALKLHGGSQNIEHRCRSARGTKAAARRCWQSIRVPFRLHLTRISFTNHPLPRPGRRGKSRGSYRALSFKAAAGRRRCGFSSKCRAGVPRAPAGKSDLFEEERERDGSINFQPCARAPVSCDLTHPGGPQIVDRTNDTRGRSRRPLYARPLKTRPTTGMKDLAGFVTPVERDSSSDVSE